MYCYFPNYNSAAIQHVETVRMSILSSHSIIIYTNTLYPNKLNTYNTSDLTLTQYNIFKL